MEREKRALAELRSLRRKNSRSPRPLPGLAANRPPSLSGDPLSTTNCTLDRIRNLTRRHQAKFSDGIPFSGPKISARMPRFGFGAEMEDSIWSLVPRSVPPRS